MNDLPPEIDASFYRFGNPDLAAHDDAQLVDHYHRWGAAEGRRASPLADRQAFLADMTAREGGRILEVGPGVRPVARGSRVRYLDVAANARPRRDNADHALGTPAPHIHYVGQVDALPRSFDAAVASRSIGHHPDLIAHLQSIGRVLVEGGRYYLIIPDARYTSAANLPLATVAGLIAANREGRRAHSAENIIAERALRLDDDVHARWAGYREPQPVEARAERVAIALGELERTSGYIDVEAWRFTPDTFRDVMAMLFHLNLSPLAVTRIWPTPFHGDEFCAVLERP